MSAQPSPSTTHHLRPLRHPNPYRHLRKNVRASLIDGSAFSMMVGIGETYLPAFIIAVGLGEVNSGLIATVPYLAGAIFQLASPTMVKLLRSYQKWILICAVMQGMAFVPLFIAAMVGYLPTSAAFLIAAVYWGSGLGVGAAWNTWIGTIIPPRTRTAFLAKRNRFIQIASLFGFVAGGVLLHSHFGDSTKPFAILFLAAFLCRACSVYWISRKTEPLPPAAHLMRSLPLHEFVLSLRKENSSGKLLLYMLGVQLAVNTCSPFFTPFMLTHLRLSYPAYAALIAASFVAKILVLPLLGRHARKEGAIALLWFGGLGIVFNPLLWLLSDNFAYLLVVQMLTGVFWASYELASVLLVLERINEHEKMTLITNYNLVNSVAMTIGSLIGASILDAMGKTPFAYYTLFAFSAVARAGTLFLLKPISAKKGKVIPFPLTVELRNFDRFVSPFQEWSKGLQRKRKRR